MATDHPEYIPREEDREFFQRELASFVPDKVFDAHTHVWHPDHNVFAGSFPPLVDYENYVRLMEDIYPGRVAKGLFIPTFRDPVNIPAANQWTGDQTAKDANCRGHFFITPEDDPEWVRQEVKAPQAARPEVLPHPGPERGPHLGSRDPRLPARVAHPGGPRRGLDHHPAHGQGPRRRRSGQHPLDPALLRELSRHAVDPGPLGPGLSAGPTTWRDCPTSRDWTTSGSTPAPTAKPWPTRPSSASSGTTSCSMEATCR